MMDRCVINWRIESEKEKLNFLMLYLGVHVGLQ